jgi:hypothetical protein
MSNWVGGLAEYFYTTEFYGFSHKEGTFHRLGDGTARNTYTSLGDTGKYVVAMLKRPELTKNAEILVSSYDADYNSVISEYEKQTGKNVRVFTETPQDQLNYGVPAPFVEMRAMLLDGRGVLTRNGEKTWNEHFPEVKPETLQQVVQNSIKQLRG